MRERQDEHAALCAYVRRHGGWIISLPGDPIAVLEALPGSALVDRLIALDYRVRPADPPAGERILAERVIERLARTPAGDLEPITADSTRPVAETRTHAGICPTTRWSFMLRAAGSSAVGAKPEMAGEGPD